MEGTFGQHDPRPVRPAVLAGTWYPADPAGLRHEVGVALAEACHSEPVRRVRVSNAPLRALILPHAGLEWSGRIAALGAKLLDPTVRRVIILGTSHFARFTGVSIDDVDAYTTPLGQVRVDRAVRDYLLRRAGFAFHPDAHDREHSIEIQLPFMQEVLGDHLRIVPAVVSALDEACLAETADNLADVIDDDTVLVGSSDLTHFGERFDYEPFPADEHCADEIRELDYRALECMLELDREAFEELRTDTGITICGYEPIRLLIETLRRFGPAAGAELLGYDTSGAMTGDYNASVSYAAVAFLGDAPTYEDDASDYDEVELDEDARRELLAMARRAVESTARFGLPPAPPEPRGKLARRGAVFVTLRVDGELRGCIGTTRATQPLAVAVTEAACSAAFEDRRFEPIREDDMPRLEIEISVLSRLSSIDEPQELVVGTHGVILEKDARRAVFLPRVAIDQGWDRTDLLSQLSRKAGLGLEAWLPGAHYAVFTVEEFCDTEKAG